MWLERFNGQSTPLATPDRVQSPAPRRSQPGLNTLPRRPGLAPRTSSLLSVAAFSGSTENLPIVARVPNGNTLRNELAGSRSEDALDPVDLLRGILGPLPVEKEDGTNEVQSEDDKPSALVEDIDFGGLSLQEFAESEPDVTEAQDEVDVPACTDFEKERDRFEDLHKSISACDEVLKSVETYLTNFRADLAAVSSEIEHLQDRSTTLNNKLDNRKAVEKVLGPEVEAFALPPSVIRKIVEGTVDDAWVKALEDFEKRVKAIQAKTKDGKDIKAAHDLRPFITDVSTKAVERIRDYVVAQIKALRSPNVNAQVIQKTAFLRYRNVFGFLATRQPQLAEEISQAYVNTMRWYYLTNFTSYKLALDKLHLHHIDQTDLLGANRTTKPSAGKPAANNSQDTFSIGRRADILRTTNTTALQSYAAEDDKTSHSLETPFRAFNLALIDNASAEYSFLTSFFPNQSFHTTNRKFTEIFTPTFQLGRDLTKQLVDASTVDALGILLCVRLTQHFAFELQRRKVPAADGYINGTNMLLWPKFQQAIDAHCESIRKVTGSLSGKPAGSGMSLTSSHVAQSTAPHPLTQRFANFLQGMLALSVEAGDDEPTSHSLGRLRGDFEAFLTKLSKGIAEARKRDRFLYNNYSLICTIIGDVEGKMAEEVKRHFEVIRDGFDV